MVKRETFFHAIKTELKSYKKEKEDKIDKNLSCPLGCNEVSDYLTFVEDFKKVIDFMRYIDFENITKKDFSKK